MTRIARKFGTCDMDINECQFSGRVTKKPRSGTTQGGMRYVAFSIAIDERAYDPSTKDYLPIVTFADVTAFGDVAEEVGWRLHVGTQVICDCYMRSVVRRIPGTNREYVTQEFFAKSVDVGRQPRHVHDAVPIASHWDD